MADGSTTLGGLLVQAGWTMVPLYLCSLAATVLIVKKVRELRSRRIDDTSALEQIPAELDPEGLTALAALDTPEASPLEQVLGTAGHAALHTPTRVEERAQRTAVAALDVLEHGLGAVSFIAQAAPLFGLLGTVIGMVELFSSMESAGDAIDTTTLSSGIWKALLTTAAGLIVAIPTLGAHAWLGSRLDRLRLQMDEAIGRVMDRRADGA